MPFSKNALVDIKSNLYVAGLGLQTMPLLGALHRYGQPVGRRPGKFRRAKDAAKISNCLRPLLSQTPNFDFPLRAGGKTNADAEHGARLPSVYTYRD